MKYALLIATVFALSYGDCAEERRLESCEKVYVQPGQISITGEGIFVYVSNEWLAAEALHADALGVYAKAKWMWICSVCGYENSCCKPVCQECGCHRG